MKLTDYDYETLTLIGLVISPLPPLIALALIIG